MDSWYVILKPDVWFQEISRYPKWEGRHLRASCTAESKCELVLSNKTNLRDLYVDFHITDGKPTAPDGSSLQRGIGLLHFHEAQDQDHHISDAFVHGQIWLNSDSYASVWDQVRDGGYVECRIDISVGPVKNLDKITWDIRRPLFIDNASLVFTRKPISEKPADQAAPRRSWFARR